MFAIPKVNIPIVIDDDDYYNNTTTTNTNLIYIAQFDTNGILTALYMVTKYIQPHHLHLYMDIHSYHIHIQVYT